MRTTAALALLAHADDHNISGLRHATPLDGTLTPFRRLAPTGEKAREVKARYRGVCRGCGAPTSARGGKGDAYEYCKECHPGAIGASGPGRSATYAIRGSRPTSRRAWWRSGARAPDRLLGSAGSAAAAIACRAARWPRKAVRPGLVSVTCRRERESARTRETSTYSAPASADRCLLRTESEISRLSRMSENSNDRTGESIAHICRRKGAWISSSNAVALTVATPEMHDADRTPARRTCKPQRSQSRLHQVPSSQGPNCRGWRADGGRSRRQQAPRQR